MKLTSTKLAILFIVIFSTAGFCQQQGMTFDFYGGGARAAGMGYAFLAVSDDGTAGTWNPAGLYIHEKTMMTFSYGFFVPRGKFTFKEGQPITATYDHTGSISSLGFWNVITPLRVKGHHIVANISYNRNFDIYYEFAENIGGAWTGDEPNALFQKKGGVSSVDFALGGRIYKELSFGISANIYTGKTVTEERRYFFRYGYKTEYNVPQLASYEQNIAILDSTTYSGFNTKIGFLYVADKIRAGLVLSTPFNLKVKSDSTIDRNSTEEGLETRTTVNGTEFATDIEYPYPKTAKIEIPLIVGLGLAYNVNENWLVAADLEYKKFSGLKIHTLESFSYNSSSSETEVFSDNVDVPNWSNVWQFRIGTEYLLNTPVGQVPVRAGFRREVLPQGNIYSYEKVYKDEQTDEFVNIDDNEPANVAKINYLFHYDQNQITGYSFSIGSGIYWSQILLDFAYTYTAYSQDIYEYASDPRYKSGNEWKNHHINLTFTGYF